MYLGTTILFSVLVLLLVGPSNIAAKKRKPDKSLPPQCRMPASKDRASLCTAKEGYQYYPQKNACNPVLSSSKKKLCQGHGGFNTIDECVYHCYDYRKMVERKNVDSCRIPIKEEEMSEKVRIPGRGDDVDAFRNDLCREPSELGVKNGSRRYANPSFRYNKDNNECVAVMDKVCLGRNRFQTKEECVHVCSWNKSSGRHRYIVRESNDKN